MKDKIIIMTEKISEFQLRKILNENDFNKEFLFDTPSNNVILKELFKNSSKNNSGNQGIPDCLFFNNETLIIMECKSSNLNFAEKDYLHYYNFVKDTNYKIYGICFVNENLFSIYEKENKIENGFINLKQFNLELKKQKITTIEMDNIIKKIHEYIRDFTKISNEDKTFFIAGCLIFLYNKTNRHLIKNFDEKRNLYDLIKESLYEKNIDYSIFEIFRNDKNNIHFLTILKMLNEIINKTDFDLDLLNKFYHEFIKYSNTDSISLGIVLTPDHIIKIMCYMLKINNNDIILDLCTGTGSFLLESSKYLPKSLIGIEYQNKLFNLLKCNIILRDINNIELIRDDCFNKNYLATKSIINPPYGMNDKTELDFIIKQLNSVNENGLCISIIPISKISDNKKMDIIYSISKIKTIIHCNQKLFHSSASIHCLILSLEKNNNGHDFYNDLVKIIDYQDDGYDIITHNGRIKNNTFIEKYNNLINDIDNKNGILINRNSDWFFPTKNITQTIEENYIEIQIQKIKDEFLEKKNNILNENKKFDKSRGNFKIFDLFESFNGKRKTKTFLKNNIGKYPYISSSKENNGISGYINIYNFDTKDKYFITLAIQGSVGSAFVISDKFWATDGIIILKPKTNLKKTTLQYICNLFKQIGKNYSFNRAMREDRLKQEILKIPINENENIDEEFIETLFN